MENMKIFAHRGYSGKYPENTMVSFMKASETGCYGIELDVQLSKDGTVVVIHDEQVDRTTDAHGMVEDFTYDELKRMNANRTHPETALRAEIPSFSDYCAWVKDTGLVTNIELKTGSVYYDGLEEKTLALVRMYGLEDRVLFSSFNPLSLVLLKKSAPGIPCGLLVEHPVVHAGKMCAASGFECYHPGLDGLEKKAVEECRDNGVTVNVWTVNTAEEKRKLASWGCGGVFTNFPEQ